MSKQSELKESVLGFINLITAKVAEGDDVEVFTDDFLQILKEHDCVIKVEIYGASPSVESVVYEPLIAGDS